MKKISPVLFFPALLLFGCDNLEVENLNDPDFQKTYSEQNRVEELAVNLINHWFMTLHDYSGPASVLLVAADACTCSWGQWRDFGSEPRIEFNNLATNAYNYISDNFFHGLYVTLSEANDVLSLVEQFRDRMENSDMTEAVACFVQGLCLGYIGLMYDKAFLVTEETDLHLKQNPLPYKDLLAAAVKSLDKAITISQASTFTLPSKWLPGESWDQDEFSRLASSFAARFLVYGARNNSEDRSTDWAQVYRYTKYGIQKDFAPLADDVKWYSLYHTYSNLTGWLQTDMYVIHLMDPGMPARFPASGRFSDLPDNGKATSADARLESDYQYLTSCPFRPERGYYHFSSYRFKRLDTYLSTWNEPMPEFRKSENDYLLAEAAVKTGNTLEAADIMNRSARVTRGNLPPLPPDRDSILAAIHYERMVELMSSGFGIQYFQMRKENLLQNGTLLHFPIPGSELNILNRNYYTFGGTTGTPGWDFSNGGW